MFHHSSKRQYDLRVATPGPSLRRSFGRPLTASKVGAACDHDAIEHSYDFLNTPPDEPTSEGRRISGPAPDGRAEVFGRDQPDPLGQKPRFDKARPQFAPQTVQQQA